MFPSLCLGLQGAGLGVEQKSSGGLMIITGVGCALVEECHSQNLFVNDLLL